MRAVASKAAILDGDYSAASGLRRAKGAAINLRVASTGDDSNDGLTVGTPLLTLTRAEQKIPVDPDAQSRITLQGAGTFTASATMLLDNTLVTSDAASQVSQGNHTVSALTLVDEGDGIEITFGAPGWTINEWAGRHFQFDAATTTVGLRGKWFAISGNSATSLFLVPDKDLTWATASSIQIGDDGDIIQFDAVIDLNEAITLLRACAGLAFSAVRFTGNIIEIASPNGVLFDRCQFTNTAVSQVGGSMELDNCSMHFSGTDSTPIQLDCLADLTLHGCAIRGNGEAGSGILTRCYSSVSWRAKNAIADMLGGVVWRPGFSTVLTNLTGDQNARIWMPDTTPSVSAFKFNDSEGSLGGGSLPRLGGDLSGTYAVEADEGARVFWDAGSTVTPALVSANGGSTNVAQAGNGTQIRGGTPAALAFTFA